MATIRRARIPAREDLANVFYADEPAVPEATLIETAVALANTEGGSIYLGVRSDGSLSGAAEQHQDTSRFAFFFASQSVPPIAIRCELVNWNPRVIRIVVPKSEDIVATSCGRVVKRVRTSDARFVSLPLYPYEMPHRIASIGHIDFSAHAVPEASVDDFDGEAVDSLKVILRSQSVDISLMNLTLDEVYAALHLTVMRERRQVPTVAGLILLGRKDALEQFVPTAQTALTVYTGTASRVDESWMLPMLLAISRIESRLLPLIERVAVTDGESQTFVPDIDPVALREGIVNACCHRDYTRAGRVHVELTNAWLSVTSPGGFMAGMPIARLLEEEAISRNPVLTSAVKRLGLTERRARGIDRIAEGALSTGRAMPVYQETVSGSVRLTVFRGKIDARFLFYIRHCAIKRQNPFGIYELLALNAVNSLGLSDATAIAGATSCDEARMAAVADMLGEQGVFAVSNVNLRRYYRLPWQDDRPASSPAPERDAAGVGRARQMELVLKEITEQGSASVRHVVELLSVSRSTALRLLTEMVKNGVIVPAGQGRSVSYQLKK